MIIQEKQYNEMPSELKELFTKLPNPGSDEVLELFPNTKSGGGNKATKNADTFLGTGFGGTDNSVWKADSGSASRFFYCAKASKSERNRWCEELEEKERIDYGGFHSEKGLIENNRNPENRLPMKNNHPTVKPLALMKYLIKLITPPGGTVLDPFAGSGSTLVAAKQNGFNYIGIEMTEEYIPIINARLNI